MLKVAICDDDSFFREKVKVIIKDIAVKNSTLLDFLEYSSGEALLSDVGSMKRCDLLVLDILMDGMNGMEVARKIRMHNNEVSILFISSYVKFCPEGYSVKAVGYILKDDFFERNISTTLKTIIPDLIRHNNEIMLKTSSGERRLKVSKIMCVESNNHYVTYYLNRNEGYSVRERFSDAAQTMQQYGFLLIHRGCIVNPAFILDIKKNYLVLVPDWEINISRDLYHMVKQKVLMYKEFSL